MGINRSRIIRIDLGRSRCSSEDIPPRLTDSYLGGRGLSFALLREFISPGLKPFDPDSPLVFCTGLLAGSSVPASGRLQISALSPATGILGSSNAGGFFAANLAAEGFRALVVTGRAQAPVMLWIEDGRAELRPAGELWGRDTWQTLEALGESKRAQAAVIGPAGENRSALAGIMLGRHSAAGRTGLGAVMGSKNLKAVAVAAKASRPEAPPPAFRKVTEAWLKELRGNELFAKDLPGGPVRLPALGPRDGDSGDPQLSGGQLPRGGGLQLRGHAEPPGQAPGLRPLSGQLQGRLQDQGRPVRRAQRSPARVRVACAPWARAAGSPIWRRSTTCPTAAPGWGWTPSAPGLAWPLPWTCSSRGSSTWRRPAG